MARTKSAYQRSRGSRSVYMKRCHLLSEVLKNTFWRCKCISPIILDQSYDEVDYRLTILKFELLVTLGPYELSAVERWRVGRYSECSQ